MLPEPPHGDPLTTTPEDGRGLELLLGSQALRHWRLARRVPLPFKERLLGAWASFWFERYLAMTEQRVRDVDLPDDPIFIVGLWRTGSTRLHEFLTATGRFTTPNTWQCFNPASFRLQPPPTEERRIERPMDASVISSFSPQEDEFAALLLGDPSVYRSFIDPRGFSEYIELLENWRTAALSPRWETFLKAVLLDAPKPLLLKSPNHTFRLPWLSHRFPKARFIWLHRSFDEIKPSMDKTWRAMAARHGRAPLDETGLAAFIDKTIEQYQHVTEWALQHLEGRIVHVDHREAIDPPHLWVEQLVEHLFDPDWRPRKGGNKKTPPSYRIIPDDAPEGGYDRSNVRTRRRKPHSA